MNEPFQPHWFGDYELVRPLGMGGMAEVFLARTVGAQGFEKVVVLKRILARLADQPRFVAMFVDEAKVAVQLQHANIVQILSFDEVSGRPFIVMEYVHGRDLHALLREAQRRRVEVPVDFGIHCLVEMLKGLGHAHNASGADGRPLRLIHRDVTPSNIFISFDGEVKLGDFGVAHSMGESKGREMRGKYGYLAPEVIDKLEVDHRADLFGAGIVLWETLAGRRLFVAHNDADVLELIRTLVPPPPSTYNPRIPPDLDRIAARALDKDRDQRFQTAMEFEEALSDYLYARRLRWTRRRIADVMQAHFREESKPLQLPPPLPRPRAQLAEIDAVGPEDPTTQRLAAVMGVVEADRARLPGFELDAQILWPESIESEVRDSTSASTFVDEEDPQRVAGPALQVHLRGADRPQALTVDGLVEQLLERPQQVEAVGVVAGGRLPRAQFGQLVFWDALCGIEEPTGAPAVSTSTDDISLTRMLYEATLRRMSGLVAVVAPGGDERRLVYLKGGYPLYVASDQLGEGALALIQRHRMIDGGLLRRGLADTVNRLVPLDRALADLDDGRHTLQVQRVFSAVIRGRLYPAFAWRGARLRVYGRARPPFRLSSRLPPLIGLLVRAVRRSFSVEELRAALLPRGMRLIALRQEQQAYLSALRLRPEEVAIIDAMDGRGGIGELCERLGARDGEAQAAVLAVIYVLVEAGLCELA